VKEWEYLWRQTFWTESGRNGDYVEWISYEHQWRPVAASAATEPFPNDAGLDRLGKSGWELVSMAPGQASLLTRASPQGDSYSSVTTYLLIFKRPLPPGDA
jgi:hypothetical protein